VLLTAAIDAMARLHYRQARTSERRVGAELRRLLASELPSFANAAVAAKFYDDFRCGLAHEARVTNGSEFSFDHPCTLLYHDGVLSVNPAHLALTASSVSTRRTLL